MEVRQLQSCLVPHSERDLIPRMQCIFDCLFDKCTFKVESAKARTGLNQYIQSAFVTLTSRLAFQICISVDKDRKADNLHSRERYGPENPEDGPRPQSSAVPRRT